jgi:hypothetical protein
MGSKIKKMNMNVAFKHIWQQGWWDQESDASNKFKELNMLS